MDETDQRAAIAWLGDAGIMGAPVEIIETHAALIFLAGDSAYKIKRAVRYDYLDFTRLADRRRMLEREFELNAAAAPGVYCDVVALLRRPDGSLSLGGTGEPVEWVLRMARFKPEAELGRIAQRGALDRALAERLGVSVASYHARAPLRPGGAALMREILDELGREFAGMAPELGAERLTRFYAGTEAAFARVAPLLDARGAAGHVRRCHGDLHLDNIVLIDGAPVPFDALEFDERLGTCDVLYDLAFLLMDLLHRGLAAQANAALNAYLAAAPAEAAGLGALPLFLAVRAAIRAMVIVQGERLKPAGDPTPARGFLAAANAWLDPAPPVLVALGGLSGSGKTTVARLIAHHLGPVPGAIHLRSDVERKALAGVDPLTRLPAEAYDAATGRAVYARLRDRAAAIIATGQAAIIDAAHIDPQERAASEAVARAAGVRFAGVWLETGVEAMKARVAARSGDASDATPDVVAAQAKRGTGALDWMRVDADGSPGDVARRVLAAIENRQVDADVTS